MPKQVFFDEDARTRILKGAEILYRAVKSTMSPKGKNVVIKKHWGITTTHDGVTVADSILINEDTPDKQGWSVGADLIKEAANKLNNEVGDGTTSVTVLTYHLMNECNKLVVAGYDPMEIRSSLELAVQQLISKLDEMTIKVDAERVRQVAAISAGDETLGHLIAEVANEVGKDGSITVEAGKGLEVTTEITDGYTIERGYFSPFFITDKARMEVNMNNPLVIVSNRKLRNADDVRRIFAQLEGKEKRNTVLFCDELSGEALNIAVMNVQRGNLALAIVRSPAYGDTRQQALEDLAAVTGASVAPDYGDEFTIGTVDKIVITKDRTTIIGGQKPKDYLVGLHEQLLATESEYDKEQLRKRIANIQGKVALIKVGGASEAEIDEKKYRVDDAVAACKAAMDGGIVVGGGIAFLELSRSVMGNDVASAALRKALEQPFRTIVGNAGLPADKLIDDVGGSNGINVMNGTVTDLLDAGVVDPVKVTKTVLRSAVSIAGTAITMDTLVVDVPDKV